MPDRKSRQHLSVGLARQSFSRASNHEEDDVHHVVQRPARCHIVRIVASFRFQRRDAPRYHNDDAYHRAVYDLDIRWIHDASAEIFEGRKEAEEQQQKEEEGQGSHVEQNERMGNLKKKTSPRK